MSSDERRRKKEELFNGAREAAGVIREHVERGSHIYIASHLDADGLASAGIVGRMLRRLDADFGIRIEKQMDESFAKEVASMEAPLTVLTDMGSGYLDILEKWLPSRDVLVLDHHQPLDVSFASLVQVNPHLHGFDGGGEISAAGVAYLTAKALDASNADLACVAIVGALGDSQDRGRRRELTSLNKDIVEDALKRGQIQVETDLIFYGRATRPIHKALASTMNPFIPGLSGEEDKCLGFLVNLGIELRQQDRWRTLTDLTVEEKQRILSELAKYYSSSLVGSLIGTVYTLTQEDPWTPLRDAREFASLFNACGKTGKMGLGVAIGMGDRKSALKEAIEASVNYRKTLAEKINWLEKTPTAIRELRNIYVILGEGVIDERMLGAITSILVTSGRFDNERSIIGLALAEDGMVKVSARATNLQLEKGLNLGAVMQEAAARFGGRGGGHDIAAGAQLPKEFEQQFIEFVDQLVGQVVRVTKT